MKQPEDTLTSDWIGFKRRPGPKPRPDTRTAAQRAADWRAQQARLVQAGQLDQASTSAVLAALGDAVADGLRAQAEVLAAELLRRAGPAAAPDRARIDDQPNVEGLGADVEIPTFLTRLPTLGGKSGAE
jgi:hypothetical protein